MVDNGLAGFIKGLASNINVPQVSNDAFYNQIIQNKINEKRLQEARDFQEKQAEANRKFQKEMLWDLAERQKRMEINKVLTKLDEENIPTLKTKKDFEDYRKRRKLFEATMLNNYDLADKILQEMFPGETEKKKSNTFNLMKFLFGDNNKLVENYIGNVLEDKKETLKIIGKYGVLGIPAMTAVEAVKGLTDLATLPMEKGGDFISKLAELQAYKEYTNGK